MIRLYFITALRNLQKNRLISAINILCLTVGLTCAALAILYARYEFSFEENHVKADRISQVYTFGKVGSLSELPNTFGGVADVLRNDYLEIEKVAAYRDIYEPIGFYENEAIYENDVLLADSSLFSILTFNFLHGQPSMEPEDLVLSEEMAIKYFGKTEVVGEILKFKLDGFAKEFNVSGVFEDLPHNTTFNASIILPMSLSPSLGWEPDKYNSTSYTILALLKQGVDIPTLNQKILNSYEIPVKIEDVRIALVPFKEIHLFANISENTQNNLWMLLIGGIIALVGASLNYININTILFSSRTKEVGIKKSFGASKGSIFTQFFVDTIITTLISFIIALMILYYLLPSFNQLFDTQIKLLPDVQTLLSLIGVFILCILLSGIYPSMIFLKTSPTRLMNSENAAAFDRKDVKNVMITLQLVFAIVLIQVLIISNRQTAHLFDDDVMGFNGDNVICMTGKEWGDLNLVKKELIQKAGIESVAWSRSLPTAMMSMTNSWKQKDNSEMAVITSVSEEFANLYKIKLSEGRFFSEDFQADSIRRVVINPLTAQSLYLDDPIGQTVEIYGKPYTIIGITNNFLAVPPIFKEMPVLMTLSGKENETLSIRIDPDKREQAHEAITSTLKKINPEFPTDMEYYNDLMEQQGKTFVASFIFMEYFTYVIIFNAMLGLFGLSFFISRQRTKEIGVRKACGASVLSILKSLSSTLIKLLVIAFFIATPLVYFIGKGFVSIFTRQVPIGVDIFILGGFLSFLMLILACGWQLYFASRANPAVLLKHD